MSPWSMPLQRRLLSLTLAVPLVVAMWVSACQGDGEGQRCSKDDDNNGDSDCANGLVCQTSGYPASYNPDQIPNFGICCPALNSGVAPTTAACAPQSTVGIDSGIPGDAGGATDSPSALDSTSGGDAADSATVPDSAILDGAGDGATLDVSAPEAAPPDVSVPDTGVADGPTDSPPG
jgi:hypothetical protein